MSPPPENVAWLPLTVLFVSRSCPELLIPPPWLAELSDTVLSTTSLEASGEAAMPPPRAATTLPETVLSDTSSWPSPL